MSKEMIVAKGLFSKLNITLNDGVLDKLIYIKPADNPLKAVEAELKAILIKFERTYFNAIAPEEETNE